MSAFRLLVRSLLGRRRAYLAPAALRRACLVVVVLGSATRAAGAQITSGTVTGIALRAEDGTPIPFALVRLLRADDPSAVAAPTIGQVITTATGRFQLPPVPAGAYRLQLARIGYRPVLSPVLHVAPGATVRQELRGATQAVELAAVTVHGGPSCLTAAQLADEPRLATLWAEAREGVEVRRAFDRQYRYARVLRQDVTIRTRFKTAHEVRVDTLVSEPDSVDVRERRLRARREAQGYARGNGLTLPDEAELLDDAFLRGHCLETAVAEADGALGLRFRPAHGRRAGADIRGTIWVAADTYQMRRLEFEYVEGDGAPYATSRVDYGDVAAGGSALRLGTGGAGTIVRPRGAARALVKGAAATFTYTYQDVRQVGAR